MLLRLDEETSCPLSIPPRPQVAEDLGVTALCLVSRTLFLLLHDSNKSKLLAAFRGHAHESRGDAKRLCILETESKTQRAGSPDCSRLWEPWRQDIRWIFKLKRKRVYKCIPTVRDTYSQPRSWLEKPLRSGETGFNIFNLVECDW